MLLEEGLANVFARHDRYAEATRRAVRAWGLELQCAGPARLRARRDRDPRARRATAPTVCAPSSWRRFNMSLGNGLGRIEDRVFRIGHMGDLGVLQLTGTLAGVEMGLSRRRAFRTGRAACRRRWTSWPATPRHERNVGTLPLPLLEGEALDPAMTRR